MWKNGYLNPVTDIGMLNLSTESDICHEQLNFLDTFNRMANISSILNHDTSNTIKIELQRRDHLLMWYSDRRNNQENIPIYGAMRAKVLVVGDRVQAVEALNTYNWPAHSSYHMTSSYQLKLKLVLGGTHIVRPLRSFEFKNTTVANLLTTGNQI
ncbi:CheY-like superfamily [Artemisia annua]|uniref:CheY-like superfamily n=1 Tax=Artemisia annua TaxID=35608 RepID=A0A2U1KXN2_ARTAN|nr:CheY-like superfamily [Artemisia annua]